jgi:hypothetical protein
MQPTLHSTLERKPEHGSHKYPDVPPDVLWVAFSIPPGSLSLVKYLAYLMISLYTLELRSRINN